MIYPNEDFEQEQFVSWFRIKHPYWLIFAVPNGGNRNIIEASKLKKTGTLAGVPDLIIMMNNRILFIEMKKRVGGKLSTVQKQIIPKIESLGFPVLVCYGAEDARNKFNAFI